MDGVSSELKIMANSSSPWTSRSFELILRVLALLLTLVSAVVVGVSKETTVLTIGVSESDAFHIPVTAKWQYMSSTVYFLVINIIGCSYAAGSLGYATKFRVVKQSKAALSMIIMDIIITGLLLSAIGANVAIGLIAQNGNSHVQWNKVCFIVGQYCHQMTAAFVLTMLGCFVFLWLSVVAVVDLHKRAT